MTARLVPGMKVRYRPQAEWGVGHLIELSEEGSKAHVLFPAREGDSVWVSTKGGALVGEALAPGTPITDRHGRPGVITAEEPGGRGLRRYVLRFDDGEDDEVPESEVRCMAPRPDLISLLREGRVGDANGFQLRRQALRLDEERRGDALGALLASRVMVKPHQLGVVQRVLSADRPRFVLADEVGLGKTIEAGMVFSALRLSGLARRVLVVAPSHLTVQWLVELSHRFHHLFAMMDGERATALKAQEPGQNPWARHELVITSLELLQRSAEQRADAAALEAAWDLVIFDEAHHLKGRRAFEAAQALARNTWGLLLLTATPMQLDPEEYHGLLTLIDEASAPSQAAFVEQLARQEELGHAVRALEAGDDVEAALKALRARFPHDARLAQLTDRDAALQHLAETYSLSEHLLRNRRATVGGFSRRVLHRHPVQVSAAELTARQAALDALAARSTLKGEVRSRLIRRLESSPAAFMAAVRGNETLSELGETLRLPERDGKFAAFRELLDAVWTREPQAKVLLFTEARETLEWLQAQLAREGVEALGYHGELSLVDRDRQVARFRDPEGPRLLLCTEVGGEGRNFQFAHHLVHYDLPWSPATVEQRIGRLDRIGQMQDVQIHTFEAPGTFSAEVLELLAGSVGVFDETVGGLDAVLEEVEERLGELALAPAGERTAYRERLAARVREARAQVAKAYDPLLDARSMDRPAVAALVARAEERLDLDDMGEDEALELEERLLGVARELDERLEDTVTSLARRVGIGVDTDDQVDAFQCAFHFGHALKVDALPGLDVTNERTVLGSFWRDTAVEQEELEYFATGHPLVEALFGFLRDGPYGRSAFRYLERRGPGRERGMELLFQVVPPEPADTAPGARVPSRQLSRYLGRSLLEVVVVDGPAGPRVETGLGRALEQEGRSLHGDEVLAAFPGLADFALPALEVGQRAAEAQLATLTADAAKAIRARRDATLERLALSAAHQGLDEGVRAQRADALNAHAEALLEALSGVTVRLDSAAGFAINR